MTHSPFSWDTLLPAWFSWPGLQPSQRECFFRIRSTLPTLLANTPVASGHSLWPTACQPTLGMGRGLPCPAQLAAHIEAAGSELRQNSEKRPARPSLRGPHIPEHGTLHVPQALLPVGSAHVGSWLVCDEDLWCVPDYACLWGAFLKIKGINSGLM